MIENVFGWFISFLAGSGVAGFFVWLSKTWISERIKSAIQTEYNEKLETHKAQLKASSDIEIERLKSELVRQNSKFNKLHEKRVEVIAELYRHIVDMMNSAINLTGHAGFVGELDKKVLANEFGYVVDKFRKFYYENKIYFSISTCEKIESIWTTMRTPILRYTASLHYGNNTLEKMDKAWEVVTEECSELKKQVEDEFRLLLGVK